MTDKLKPCPFCGGEAKVAYNPNGTYSVGCSTKGCDGNLTVTQSFGKRDAIHHRAGGRDAAIAAWNTRAECPDPFTCKFVLDAFDRGREDGLKTMRTCEGCKHKGSDPYSSPCYGCTHNNYDDCYEVEAKAKGAEAVKSGTGRPVPPTREVLGSPLLETILSVIK